MIRKDSIFHVSEDFFLFFEKLFKYFLRRFISFYFFIFYGFQVISLFKKKSLEGKLYCLIGDLLRSFFDDDYNENFGLQGTLILTIVFEEKVI